MSNFDDEAVWVVHPRRFNQVLYKRPEDSVEEAPVLFEFVIEDWFDDMDLDCLRRDVLAAAAAPELLAALKIMRVQFGTYTDGDGAAKFHACNIADAAINKAEGRGN